MKEYMSGDELYRYLHISKRKMKYLLENGYIPMVDTGMKTHRYRVKYEDARAFKRRLEKEPLVRADRDVQYQLSAKENAAARSDGGKLQSLCTIFMQPIPKVA